MPDDTTRGGASGGEPLQGTAVVLCGQYPEQIAPVAKMLEELGCIVHQTDSPEQLEALLKAECVDVVFTHLCPSRPRLMEILGRKDLPPIVALLADKDLYFESLTRGAFDCLPLRPHWTELVRVTRLAVGRGKEQGAIAISA